MSGLSCSEACKIWGFPGGSVVKNPPANAGDTGSIPGSGRSTGGGNGNPLQYSCLENSIDRGAWWTPVHGVAKSRTRMRTHTCGILVPQSGIEPESPALKGELLTTQLYGKSHREIWNFKYLWGKKKSKTQWCKLLLWDTTKIRINHTQSKVKWLWRLELWAVITGNEWLAAYKHSHPGQEDQPGRTRNYLLIYKNVLNLLNYKLLMINYYFHRQQKISEVTRTKGDKILVLVFCCCCMKQPQAGWFKTTHLLSCSYTEVWKASPWVIK